MKASELRELNEAELDKRLGERQSDIIHFRLQQATGVVDNVCGAREARKDISRIKTILREREAAAKGTN